MTANKYKTSFRVIKMKLDNGDDCTILNNTKNDQAVHFRRVHFMVCALYM